MPPPARARFSQILVNASRPLVNARVKWDLFRPAPKIDAASVVISDGGAARRGSYWVGLENFWFGVWVDAEYIF